MARYGGEEFGCILPKTNLEGAVLIAQKFHNEILSLQISHLHSPTHSFVSISQGVATLIPAKNVLKETLLKMADQALYKAKTIGRNTFCTS